MARKTVSSAKAVDRESSQVDKDNFDTGSQMDPRVLAVIQTIQRNILMLIGVVALIVALTISANTLHKRDDMLLQQEAEISQLERDLASAKAKNDAKYRDTIQSAIGVSMQRKADDDRMMTEMMRLALTWKSVPEYLKVRDKVKAQYDFTDETPFMKTFMPGEMQGVARKDASGAMNYSYDENLSSEFKSMQTYVTGTDGDVYHYFAIVETNHYSPDNRGSSTGTSIMTYDIQNGEIFNLVGVPSVNVEHAGKK